MNFVNIHLSCQNRAKGQKKKKNSEYDKRKLVDLCKITNDKSYEIRDEQDGGGGFYLHFPASHVATGQGLSWKVQARVCDQQQYFAGLIVLYLHCSATLLKIIIIINRQTLIINRTIKPEGREWRNERLIESYPISRQQCQKGRDAETSL